MGLRRTLVYLSLGSLGAVGPTAARPAANAARLQHTADPGPVCDTVRRYLSGPASRRIRIVADSILAGPYPGTPGWPRRGCVVTAVDTLNAPPDDHDLYNDWFEARGWTPALRYDADGPDGTMWGVVHAGILCVAMAEWDGGDDSDTTYVPQPGFTLDVGCIPAVPADTASH